jgi:hypothetical protein
MYVTAVVSYSVLSKYMVTVENSSSHFAITVDPLMKWLKR